MAYSALPALEIDPLKRAAEQAQAEAQTRQTNQNTAGMQQQTEERSALEPFLIKDAQRQSQLADMSANNATLAQVAKDTLAADPEDAPDIWDRGMKDAADNGNTSAGQYIGHYRPDLAERVGDIYGGQGGDRGGRSGAGGAGSSPAPDPAVERAVASMTPQQIDTSLQRSNMLISSFNNVKDRDSWNAELQLLKDNGIDVAHILPNQDWNPLNYAAAARAIKSLVPYRDALANRSAIMAVGGTPPAPTPLGTTTYIGTDPATQQPIYHNPVTGEDTKGKNPVGPKPTAAVSTFQYKLRVAKESGLSDQDAMAFANGTKSLPPERLRAMANQQAQKELGDIILNNEYAPDAQKIDVSNPKQWLDRRSNELYGQLTDVQVKPRMDPAGGVANLPQRAIATVKAAGGKSVRFNNGLVYKWDAKAKRAVPVK